MMQNVIGRIRRAGLIRHWQWSACVAAAIAIPASRAVAQPANDFFTNASPIMGLSGSVIGNNVGATLEPAEPVIVDFTGFPIGGASVWYRWVAPASGTVTFDTLGSTYDTVLASYTGTNLATLTLVAANDDFAPPMRWSRVTWLAQMGTEYRIAVDGFLGFSMGGHVLNWIMSGVPTNQPPTPGRIQFEADKYLVSEGAPGFATIHVTYGGGAPGAVSVDYSTQDGSAQDGLDYESRSGALVFLFGETNKSFTVPIFDNAVPNTDRTVNLAFALG